jgi:hypothetical protein
VAKLQGRWFLPFLIKLPLVRLKKGEVTDEDVRRRCKRLSADSCMLSEFSPGCSEVILAKEGNSAPETSQDRGIPVVLTGGKQKDRTTGKCAIQLTTQEREFLMDVWQHPTSAVRQRYGRLRLSSYCGNFIQRSLFRRDLVCFFHVLLCRGRIKTLILTDRGKEVLGINERESDRHGGPEHKYWTRVIAEHLEANGYEVSEEVPIGGGKAIDIVASRHGRRIAFEIETGKSDAAANVQKCLDAGMDKVMVVLTSSSARRDVPAAVIENPNVEVVTGLEALQKTES